MLYIYYPEATIIGDNQLAVPAWSRQVQTELERGAKLRELRGKGWAAGGMHLGVVGDGQRGGQCVCMSMNECESCFSYLSHSGVGMSQLDHHGKVRSCELEETRGNHSLASQSISTKALGAACAAETVI